MLEKNKLIIRPMKDGEQKEIVKVGKRAFKLMEALFVGTPKQAMVADYNGKIAGSIMYKYFNTKTKKIAYIDEAFVDPEFSGMGIGKMLYSQTFDFLWKQGCDNMTALVKDDNVGSWKLFEDNHFKRVSCYEIIKELGIIGFIKHYIKTPFLFAVGMDFYMANKTNTVKEKKNNIIGVLSFFLANILLLIPLWIRYFNKNSNELLWGLLGYITILVIFLVSRYIGKLISGNNGEFRFNNGGSFLTLLLSFWGNTFPMNANWYPKKYEKTKEFRKKLAIPELIKWVVFMILPLIAMIWIKNPYWLIVGQLSCVYLLFMAIPIYPFESFGGGRIYNYNKGLWLLTFITTILELVIVFNFTS